MRTRQRVARGMGWIAAAGLLALLISTNCGTTDQVMQEECGPNGECPAGFLCNPVNNRCFVGDAAVCAEGNAQTCPIGQTCYPPMPGPGECKAPAQVACDGLAPGIPPSRETCSAGTCPAGQRCGTITVHTPLDPRRVECGCVPGTP